MTFARREEIFSKELITINDLVELTGKPYPTVSEMLRKMKVGHDRVGINGVIHVLDYFEAMGIDPKDPGPRYCKPLSEQEQEQAPEILPQIRRTVNLPELPERKDL